MNTGVPPLHAAARLSVAPMMDWTDRHCRALHRLLSRRALLYTEMVTAAAILHGPRDRLLRFDPLERPVALQVGGSDPADLARAAAIGGALGYAEVNLNCGCPSPRVQRGAFGAVLMERPALVREALRAMREATDAEVTLKCRIGVDGQDPAQALPAVLDAAQEAGVARVAIHARKAWLQGLSPKENREVPPLDRPLALAMKARFPGLHVTVNGGVRSLDEARALLAQGFDGVMVGRSAYHAPWDILGRADSLLWGDPDPLPTPQAAALAMLPHVEAHLREGGRLHDVTRHMLGLFAGRPGARAWRRLLSEGAARPGAGVEALLGALREAGEERAVA